VPRVWLVRHGEPIEAVGVDPGLTAAGHEQAARLVASLAPAAIVTSPLRRARETAAPLERAWLVTARVDEAVSELPSPSGVTDRAAWLGSALRASYPALGDEHRRWRDGLLGAVGSFEVDTVVTTHAVAVNAVVGSIVGDDRVLHFRPAHASITIVDVDRAGNLALVERGAQMGSIIL
jgi:broad specificity phosphatase PhoE